eukprot:TRINITY_DN10583_c0_g1_i10.p1 TRINITY_DN10583_c0_g1~~TRINITY_DN10583_c0_g1_i10.p1  ORF type:complete len:127 (+),score=30.30 TRINITY_DN10583_c0_g1_i10:46-381(+)
MMRAEDIAEKLQELALNWLKLGNASYRLHKTHQLQWINFLTLHNDCELDVKDLLIACGQNGGPIAVAKKSRKFIEGSEHLLLKHILIFNGCGLLIAKPNVNFIGTLVEQQF